MLLAALVLKIQIAFPYAAFQEQLTAAWRSEEDAQVRKMFAEPRYADYLLHMARERGEKKLAGMQITFLPSPPGWERLGPAWAVFSRRQDIEEHHDVVCPLIKSPSGWVLGAEIPETASNFVRIKTGRFDAHLHPAQGKVDVDARLSLDWVEAPRRAPVFRLGDWYWVKDVLAGGKEEKVLDAASGWPAPKPGDWVRAGSLLIRWSAQPVPDAEFRYTGEVVSKVEDSITTQFAYVTAWWTPSVDRSPYLSSVRITGPKGWVLRSEGETSSANNGWPKIRPTDDEQTVAYSCSVPIAYPKVIGGAYLLAKEAKVNGKRVAVYQFPESDPAVRAEAAKRADTQIDLMIKFLAGYEKTLGPFPFSGYESFDSKTYYGIESYSYTLLHTSIGVRYVTHEMGHTYFGGLIPCGYVEDSWNEGATEYIDGLVLGNSVDNVIEYGFRSLKTPQPLDQMPVAHDYGGHSYWRGGYVWHMLEEEIGLGSSRVDLQACKLEYSIVSPK